VRPTDVSAGPIRAGYDIGKGFAREGANNAWVRGSTGWNAINRFHDVEPGETFTVYA